MKLIFSCLEQLPPSPDPLGSIFGPTWLQHTATLPQVGPFGATSAQVEVHMASTSGTRPTQYEFLKTFVFIPRFFPALMCLRWAQLPAKLSPKVCKLRHFERVLDLHVHHMASVWGASGGANLGSSRVQDSATWAKLGAFGGSPGPTRPILRTQRDKLKTCILTAISNVFCLWLGMLPTSVLSWAFKLGLSWSQLARVRRKLRPSCAPVWPQSALVGPTTPAAFLSIRFSGCGRFCGWFSLRSDSNKRIKNTDGLPMEILMKIGFFSDSLTKTDHSISEFTLYSIVHHVYPCLQPLTSHEHLQRPPQVKDLIQNMITSRKEEATFNRWIVYLEVSWNRVLKNNPKFVSYYQWEHQWFRAPILLGNFHFMENSQIKNRWKLPGYPHALETSIEQWCLDWCGVFSVRWPGFGAPVFTRSLFGSNHLAVYNPSTAQRLCIFRM